VQVADRFARNFESQSHRRRKIELRRNKPSSLHPRRASYTFISDTAAAAKNHWTDLQTGREDTSLGVSHNSNKRSEKLSPFSR